MRKTMIIKPFPAIRPDRSYATLLNVPPYDVVSVEEVRDAVKNNPFSFFHVTRAEADLDNPYDEYSPAVYSKARENFKSFIKKNILIKDPSDCFYILSQTLNGQTQTGIYTAVSCEEYEKNLIKKHELTRHDKELDRTSHIKTVKADTGPVFLAFEDKNNDSSIYFATIKQFSEKLPVYDFIDENKVENKLWIISEKNEIKRLQKYFQKTNAFYIADGHHRAASAVNVWREKAQGQNSSFGYFLAVIFPASQLKVLSYNRLVKDLNGKSYEEMISEIEKSFDISYATSSLTPGKKGVIGMYMNNTKYLITIKKKLTADDPLESLDVSILQKFILAPILGINDPRTSENLIFTEGNKGEEYLINKVDNRDAMAAFSLYPVNINDLIKITESSRLMPPKSTWFEPKLRDGLVIYSLE
jgi:uncharacterized protein (DUF1015 family)